MPYARAFILVKLRAGVRLISFHIHISCHSLSQQKIRDYPQPLNSASWGPAGSRPLRSHYIYNTSFLLLKNFVPELHALQMTLIRPHTGVHQSAFIWTMHRALLSVSFLLFLCYGRIQPFQNQRCLSGFAKLLNSFYIPWKGQRHASQTAYLICASPPTLLKLKLIFPPWKKHFICT